MVFSPNNTKVSQGWGKLRSSRIKARDDPGVTDRWEDMLGRGVSLQPYADDYVRLSAVCELVSHLPSLEQGATPVAWPDRWT